jgi:hypothetical protein
VTRGMCDLVLLTLVSSTVLFRHTGTASPSPSRRPRSECASLGGVPREVLDACHDLPEKGFCQLAFGALVTHQPSVPLVSFEEAPPGVLTEAKLGPFRKSQLRSCVPGYPKSGLMSPIVRAGGLNGHLALRSEQENNRQRRREIFGPSQREEPP